MALVTSVVEHALTGATSTPISESFAVVTPLILHTYVRVTAETMVTVVATWQDASGATHQPVLVSGTYAAGCYPVAPYYLTASGTLTLAAVAGAADAAVLSAAVKVP